MEGLGGKMSDIVEQIHILVCFYICPLYNGHIKFKIHIRHKINLKVYFNKGQTNKEIIVKDSL